MIFNTVIAGGGGSASPWTHLTHEEVEVSTTSTSTSTVINIILPALIQTKWIVYIQIRDMAGLRDGYFAGSDTFAVSNVNTTSGIGGAITPFAVACFKCTSAANKTASVSRQNYGVFPHQFISRDDALRISSRYNATNSGTIDGTYSIDVFTLDYPEGYPSLFDE